MDNSKVLDISGRTIFKISLAVIGFYFLYVLRDILIWLLFALIISVLFEPAISFLQKKKIPRLIGTILIYASFFGVFSTLVWLVIPIFAQEISQFIISFPQYFEKVSPLMKGLGFQAFESLDTFTKSLEGVLGIMGQNIFNVLFAFFGGVFSTLFVVATATFISLDEKSIERVLVLIFPKKYEDFALHVWARTQKKVSGWFAARIISCLFVGLATYVTFLIFDVKYPLILALFSGVFNFVPYIGALATGILLFLIIFPAEMIKAIFVLVGYWLVQQIDGHILSPILMKRMVNIPPALVIISLVVGAKLWGFLGALLIIPLTGIIFEFTGEFLKKRKARENTG